MSRAYDPKERAEEAIRLAMASAGAERQRLIQLALTWHALAGERASPPGAGDREPARRLMRR